MSEPIDFAEWARLGERFQEMDEAGLKFELHRTAAKSPSFAWSFAYFAGRVENKKFYYGETPFLAVQRGFDAWLKSIEADPRQGTEAV